MNKKDMPANNSYTTSKKEFQALKARLERDTPTSTESTFFRVRMSVSDECVEKSKTKVSLSICEDLFFLDGEKGDDGVTILDDGSGIERNEVGRMCLNKDRNKDGANRNKSYDQEDEYKEYGYKENGNNEYCEKEKLYKDGNDDFEMFSLKNIHGVANKDQIYKSKESLSSSFDLLKDLEVSTSTKDFHDLSSIKIQGNSYINERNDLNINNDTKLKKRGVKIKSKRNPIKNTKENESDINIKYHSRKNLIDDVNGKYENNRESNRKYKNNEENNKKYKNNEEINRNYESNDELNKKYEYYKESNENKTRNRLCKTKTNKNIKLHCAKITDTLRKNEYENITNDFKHKKEIIGAVNYRSNPRIEDFMKHKNIMKKDNSNVIDNVNCDKEPAKFSVRNLPDYKKLKFKKLDCIKREDKRKNKGLYKCGNAGEEFNNNKNEENINGKGLYKYGNTEEEYSNDEIKCINEENTINKNNYIEKKKIKEDKHHYDKIDELYNLNNCGGKKVLNYKSISDLNYNNRIKEDGDKNNSIYETINDNELSVASLNKKSGIMKIKKLDTKNKILNKKKNNTTASLDPNKASLRIKCKVFNHNFDDQEKNMPNNKKKIPQIRRKRNDKVQMVYIPIKGTRKASLIPPQYEPEKRQIHYVKLESIEGLNNSTYNDSTKDTSEKDAVIEKSNDIRHLVDNAIQNDKSSTEENHVNDNYNPNLKINREVKDHDIIPNVYRSSNKDKAILKVDTTSIEYKKRDISRIERNKDNETSLNSSISDLTNDNRHLIDNPNINIAAINGTLIDSSKNKLINGKGNHIDLSISKQTFDNDTSIESNVQNKNKHGVTFNDSSIKDIEKDTSIDTSISNNKGNFIDSSIKDIEKDTYIDTSISNNNGNFIDLSIKDIEKDTSIDASISNNNGNFIDSTINAIEKYTYIDASINNNNGNFIDSSIKDIEKDTSIDTSISNNNGDFIDSSIKDIEKDTYIDTSMSNNNGNFIDSSIKDIEKDTSIDTSMSISNNKGNFIDSSIKDIEKDTYIDTSISNNNSNFIDSSIKDIEKDTYIDSSISNNNSNLIDSCMKDISNNTYDNYKSKFDASKCEVEISSNKENNIDSSINELNNTCINNDKNTNDLYINEINDNCINKEQCSRTTIGINKSGINIISNDIKDNIRSDINHNDKNNINIKSSSDKEEHSNIKRRNRRGTCDEKETNDINISNGESTRTSIDSDINNVLLNDEDIDTINYTISCINDEIDFFDLGNPISNYTKDNTEKICKTNTKHSISNIPNDNNNKYNIIKNYMNEFTNIKTKDNKENLKKGNIYESYNTGLRYVNNNANILNKDINEINGIRKKDIESSKVNDTNFYKDNNLNDSLEKRDDIYWKENSEYDTSTESSIAYSKIIKDTDKNICNHDMSKESESLDTNDLKYQSTIDLTKHTTKNDKIELNSKITNHLYKEAGINYEIDCFLEKKENKKLERIILQNDKTENIGITSKNSDIRNKNIVIYEKINTNDFLDQEIDKNLQKISNIPSKHKENIEKIQDHALHNNINIIRNIKNDFENLESSKNKIESIDLRINSNTGDNKEYSKLKNIENNIPINKTFVFRPPKNNFTIKKYLSERNTSNNDSSIKDSLDIKQKIVHSNQLSVNRNPQIDKDQKTIHNNHLNVNRDHNVAIEQMIVHNNHLNKNIHVDKDKEKNYNNHLNVNREYILDIEQKIVHNNHLNVNRNPQIDKDQKTIHNNHLNVNRDHIVDIEQMIVNNNHLNKNIHVDKDKEKNYNNHLNVNREYILDIEQKIVHNNHLNVNRNPQIDKDQKTIHNNHLNVNREYILDIEQKIVHNNHLNKNIHVDKEKEKNLNHRMDINKNHIIYKDQEKDYNNSNNFQSMNRNILIDKEKNYNNLMDISKSYIINTDQEKVYNSFEVEKNKPECIISNETFNMNNNIMKLGQYNLIESKSLNPLIRNYQFNNNGLNILKNRDENNNSDKSMKLGKTLNSYEINNKSDKEINYLTSISEYKENENKIDIENNGILYKSGLKNEIISDKMHFKRDDILYNLTLNNIDNYKKDDFLCNSTLNNENSFNVVNLRNDDYENLKLMNTVKHIKDIKDLKSDIIKDIKPDVKVNIEGKKKYERKKKSDGVKTTLKRRRKITNIPILNEEKAEVATSNEIKKFLKLKTVPFKTIQKENVKKINEATFSEVFMVDKMVVKIIPLETEAEMIRNKKKRKIKRKQKAKLMKKKDKRRKKESSSTETDSDTDSSLEDINHSDPKKRSHNITEINFLKECYMISVLSSCSAVIQPKEMFIAKGCYPINYINAWVQYKNKNKKVENKRPKSMKSVYGIIMMEFGGIDLESFIFRCLEEVEFFFNKIIDVLYELEVRFRFEHRDLHWGNILIKRGESILNKKTSKTSNIQELPIITKETCNENNNIKQYKKGIFEDLIGNNKKGNNNKNIKSYKIKEGNSTNTDKIIDISKGNKSSTCSINSSDEEMTSGINEDIAPKKSKKRKNCTLKKGPMTHKLDIKIIDFTLSRINHNNKIIFTDLNEKPWLFEGDEKIDIQYGIYKKMKKIRERLCKDKNEKKKKNGKKVEWKEFDRSSNFLWFIYLIKKIEEKIGENNICKKWSQMAKRHTSIRKIYEAKHKVLVPKKKN